MRKGLLLVLGLALLLPPSVVWADRPADYYSTVTKAETATTAQSETTLWDPDAGKRIILQGCNASATGALRFSLGDVGGSAAVSPLMIIQSHGTVPLGGGAIPMWMGDVDEVLTYTTTASLISGAHQLFAILCYGYEQ